MSKHSRSPYQYQVSPGRNPFADLPPNHRTHDHDPFATPTASQFSLNSMNSPAMNSSKPLRQSHIRTPSPTPSEAKEMKTGAINWKAMAGWRFWIRREWLWYYVAAILIIVVTVLITVFHKQIVVWLTPAARWMHDLPFGWAIPIAILFIISFPPLFGHEIVAILCGVVWGLWVGFAIVSAGTFLGEVGNFYAFKACCRSRGEKLERTKLSYACLAKVVREGGFRIALVARLSAIPGHFTTAIFSTCGMGIIVFSLAAILSLPKQFITVYLGVILEQSGTGKTDTKSRIISDVVLGITFLITIAAMWYILREMNKVKPEIIYKRRRARIGKISRIDTASIDSDTMPLTTPDTPYQHWDRRGAPSNTSEVELFAPVPERAVDYSQGYQMIHGVQRQRDEEQVEWDMSMSSSSAYDGIEEESPASHRHIGNYSAASSTSTLHAPVPQRHPRPEFLRLPGGGSSSPRIQPHPADGERKVTQTPTRGAFVVSFDAAHPLNDSELTAVPASIGAEASTPPQDVTDLPYRSGLVRSSQNGTSSSPPPPSYRA